MKFSDYLIISDLDGTLCDSTHSIPQANQKAIEHFVENGGRFTIGTGRSLPSLQSFLGQLNVNFPAVLYNGMAIYDTQRSAYLHSEYLPEVSKQITFQVLEKFRDIGYVVFDDYAMYSSRANVWLDKMIDIEKVECIVTELQNMPDQWMKVIFVGPHERLEDVGAYMDTLDCTGCKHLFTQELLYEIIPQDANKGKALSLLRDKCGKQIKVVCAAGDYYNDIEMLQTADIAFVPAGAPEEIRSYAQHVVCPVGQGSIADVVRFIEQHAASGRSAN